VRDALARSLPAAGHTVAAFASGRQFLDAYQLANPGCLVVDMDLSDLGAVEFLRKLAVSRGTLPAITTSRRLRRRTLARFPARRSCSRAATAFAY
jgi:FixJ family two-component response regulator